MPEGLDAVEPVVELSAAPARRAMIAEDGPDTSSPRRLLTVIYGFSGAGSISDALNITQKHLEVFAGAQIFASSVLC